MKLMNKSRVLCIWDIREGEGEKGREGRKKGERWLVVTEKEVVLLYMVMVDG